MALYVLVHHRKAQEQPWSNAWLDDDLLDAITTTAEIGRLCEQARLGDDEVFVHRCAWGSPEISCAVRVGAVDPLPRRQALVRFVEPRRVGVAPAVTPHEGQNHYLAPSPSE